MSARRMRLGRGWPTLVSLVLCTAWAAGCTASSPAGMSPPRGEQQAVAGRALLASRDRLLDRPVESGGCGRRPLVRPGTTARLTVAVPPAAAAGTRRRSYLLHVPARYASGHPTPLVLAFHGGGGTAAGMERSSGLSVLADRRGFLVAYPQGLAQQHGRGPTGWDASGPRDPAADGIDDGLFVSNVLNAIQSGYCVDPARIAATGMSNGGSMTGYLACVLSDRIAAFAPVEGVFFQIPGGCHPAHPVAVLDVHVRTDPVAPYAGVPSRGSPDYYALAIPAWLAGWARRDGCRLGPRLVAGARGVEAEHWTRCPAGVGVTGYVFPSGGHAWFRAIGAEAGDNLILSFFIAHPLLAVRASWRPRPAEPVPALTAPEIAVSSVRVFTLPTPDAEPFDLAAGPDGSVWFTEFRADMIGRISQSGALTQYKVPTADAGPYQIAAGPHGSMWFTEYNTTKVGRVSPNGNVAEFRLRKPTSGGTGIIGSASGPVLMADPAGAIDRISAAGAISRTKVPSSFGFPFAIARLRSGTVWLSELTGYYEFSRHLLSFRLGSGQPAQTVTLPDRLSNIVALTPGPAGALWFADFGANQVGEVSPSGRVRAFGDRSPYGGISDLTAGPDGDVWLTEQDGLVAQISPDGNVGELALPSPGSNPDGITTGPGRTLWIAETGADAIVKITLP
jgi:polyhydroxybutyrate depolymerase